MDPHVVLMTLYQIRSCVSQGLRDLLWKEEGILPSPLRGLPRPVPGGVARPGAGPRREGLM